MHIASFSDNNLYVPNIAQSNLENSKKTLHELQENYRIAISTLKEKELIISKQIHSGIWSNKPFTNDFFFIWPLPIIIMWLFHDLETENCLIDCAKDLRKNLQNASEDITSLFARIGTLGFLFVYIFCWHYILYLYSTDGKLSTLQE